MNSSRNILALCMVFFSTALSFLCAQSHNTNFRNGDGGWVGAYMGYPSGAESSYELNVSWAKIPIPDMQSRFGLVFSGKNYSGKVFLYAYKRISGLRPNSSYKVIFNVDIMSDHYPNKEGDKIFFKGGTLNKQPNIFENRIVESNFSKGEIGNKGRNMDVLGEIKVPKQSQGYTSLILHNYTQALIGNTNRDGEMWLLVGVEPQQNLRSMPNVYINTLRVLFKYNGELKAPSIAATSMNLVYTPENQNLYFESEFDYDLEDLCIYTEEGHLIKILNFNKQFVEHTVNTSDLSEGKYYLVFNLIDGRRIVRDLQIE